jgi:cation diffusion facilitator family transporter
MKTLDAFEYPEELMPVYHKARRLEWITLAYILSAAVFVYLTMGNSQAMKTAWFEDLLSLTPSVSFLIASRLALKEPNGDFPYGYHRAASIAYLCSAVALLAVGGFLLVDSTITLLKAEHPTIGTVVLFGKQVWLGYLMIAAMLWSTFPSLYLGLKKLPLAEQLHDKNLYTDAEMNKADWMTAVAAIFGIVGIGFGLWWADAAAAAIISLDIVRDGYSNLKQAVFDLMNQIPKTVDEKKPDPLIQQVQDTLNKHDWVRNSTIRLREEGHVYFGEGFVVCADGADLPGKLEDLSREVEGLDWRIQEFVITPVRQLPEAQQ